MPCRIQANLFLTYSANLHLSRLIAIRYIGGILELPAFWAKEYYQLQRYVVEKLCSRTVSLIEDIDIDAPAVDGYTRISWDTEGIDILAAAILSGVQGWIQRQLAADLKAEPWFCGLLELTEQLRRQVLFYFPLISIYLTLVVSSPRARDYFRSASCRAANLETSLKLHITGKSATSVWTSELVFVNSSEHRCVAS